MSTTHKESRSRLQTLAACLLGFALIGGGIFFWRQASEPSASAPLNVLIVLVDTLRADHLGHHGYPRDTSPRIDQFAENATAFMNHYSQAPRTGPAVASLFTGLHPLSHGAINPLSRWNAMGTLASEKTTLAEILEGAGYENHGIVGNPNVSPRFGFGQGFDTYEVLPDNTSPDLSDLPLDEPFFAYLHFMEPHSPYQAPKPYDDLFTDPQYSGPVDGSHGQLDRIVAGKLSLDDADKGHLVALYDQEIRNFDKQFGELLDQLDERGLSDRTIVVLVSDHGEELLDHGSALHGYTLYEEQLHVPFVIHDPRSDRSRVIRGRTQHVDLLPTLLDLLDIEHKADLPGRSLAETVTGQETELGDSAPVFALASLKAVRTVKGYSLLMDDWKWIEFSIPKKSALYHIKSDGEESKDLSEERPLVAARLRKELERLIYTTPTAKPSLIDLTESEKSRLRALGYLP